ncbi:MAG: DUF4034 domain-containing protein [Pseudomonadota bacterium]
MIRALTLVCAFALTAPGATALLTAAALAQAPVEPPAPTPEVRPTEVTATGPAETLVPDGAEKPVLGLDGAKALLWGRDVDALEAAFTRHRAAFLDGSITADGFAAPFDAFRVWHLPHRETVEAWTAAYPESPAAATALGAVFEEVALVERDARSIDALQPEQAVRAIDATRRSAKAYIRALSLSSRQVYAAARILQTDPRVLPQGLQDEAQAALDTHGSPLLPLRLAVARHRLDDAGYSDEVLGLCEVVVSKVDGLLLEECLAFALHAHTVSMVDKARYLLILENDAEQHFPRAIFEIVFALKGAGPALDYAIEQDLFFDDTTILMRLGANDPDHRLTDASLAHDPTDPIMLAGRAWSHALDGEDTQAFSKIAAAHLHGGHLHAVWRLERQILDETGRHHEILEWYERAVATRELDPQAWMPGVLRYFDEPEAAWARRADGVMHDDAACRIRRLILELRPACARMVEPHSLCHSSLERLDEVATALAEGCD